jgi:PIN domain nuclease of toxin-antitoxin system
VILLDTQAAIWFITDSGLGKRSQAMADKALADDGLAISAITFWEIALLITKGRLRAVESASEMRRQVLDSGVAELALSGDIALRAVGLGNLPKDPADRFIVATAIDHGAMLMTADKQLLNWKHPLRRQDAER